MGEIPADLRSIYKTVWEISQKQLINLAADRGHFIDQSQSFNIHMNNPNFGKLTSMHFYGWKKGLKTGMYYLRTKAAADAIKFTVDQAALEKDSQAQLKAAAKKNLEAMSCALDKGRKPSNRHFIFNISISNKTKSISHFFFLFLLFNIIHLPFMIL